MGECFVSSFSHSCYAGMGLKPRWSSQDLTTPKGVGLEFGGERSLNVREEKMLMVGDFNLNSVQGRGISLKDILKQTMLSQENIFRNQVHELHCLYRRQKALMEDFGRKEFDGYNLWKEQTQSPSVSGLFTNSIKYSPLGKERTNSGSPSVGPTQFANRDFLGVNRSGYSTIQRPSDFQLPANQQDHHVVKGDLLGKGNGCGLKESEDAKHWFHDYTAAYPEEVKLTLSIGGNAKKIDSYEGTNCKKFTSSSSYNVIDLEESTDTVSNEVTKSASTLISCSAHNNGDKHDLRVSVQSNRVSANSVKKKEISHGLTVSYPLVDCSASYEEHNSSNKGFRERDGDITLNDMFIKLKPSTSHKAIGIDLNTVMLDDPSPFSANPSLMDSDIPSAAFKDVSQREASPIDLESVPGPTSDINEDLGSNCMNSSNGNSDSHSSCKVKTLQSGTDFGGSNASSFDHLPKPHSSQNAETQSLELNLRSSTSSEPTEEALIQKAAESLISFSLGSSSSNHQDSCTKVGSNEFENDKRDQPQHSLDSYESIVLKLTESSLEDYCVDSKPCDQVNEFDKADCGIKIRRGRRLKDFQRDILPSLASLSRHEIREDVNIMETVIRSREYKRLRSKTAVGGGNWFTPVKSRRSKLNYVGRRFYS